MSREIIETGKTIEIAVRNACEKLGVSEDDVNIEILEKPKKLLLGFKSTPAKVKVSVEWTKADYAKDFVTSVLDAMDASGAKVVGNETETGYQIVIEGEELGFLIGKHGETLDAIQYIAGLVVNQIDGEYYRVNIDCGNFREKREQSLVELAGKLAAQVVKTGRNVTLEPMNPYERRIIHSTCQTIKDVTSASVGVEPNRCVVISCTNPAIIAKQRRFNDSKSSGRNQGYKKGGGKFSKDRRSSGSSNNNNRRPSSRFSGNNGKPYNKPSTYKNNNTYQNTEKPKPISDKDHAGALYGKIDLE